MGVTGEIVTSFFSGVVFYGVYAAVLPLDQSPRMAEHAGLTPASTQLGSSH